VNAEFNVWLLIVGLVVGAGLAWVVMMDGRRRETEIDAQELPREAAWLSAILAEDGYDVSPEAAEQALRMHRAYLGAPPPDPVVAESAMDVRTPEHEPGSGPEPEAESEPEPEAESEPEPEAESEPEPGSGPVSRP
jgi:hypothetical protein